MKPEQRLWQTVKEHLPWKQKDRVENVAGVGMPDIYGCNGGQSYWMELKVQSAEKELEPKSPLELLRPAQRVWHLKHAQAGGFVFVLIKNGQRLTLHASRGTWSKQVWEGSGKINWEQFKIAVLGGRAEEG